MRKHWAALIVTLLGMSNLALSACGAPTPTAPDASQSSSPTGSASSVAGDPFTIAAAYSAKSLGLDRPSDVALAPDGNAYVVDAGQHVTVVAPNGRVVRRWGGSGKAPGKFNFVKHDEADDIPTVAAFIAVGHDGKVYVSDGGNARIQVFSADGTFLRQFGHSGKGADGWLFPVRLTVDADDSVYVADDFAASLWRFDPSGQHAWTLRTPTATDPDVQGPFYLAGVDDHHRVFAIASDRQRVVALDARGHKVDAFGEPTDFPDGACDASLDAQSNLYVNSCHELLSPPHHLTVFNRAHQVVSVWSPSPLSSPPKFGPHGEIFAIRDSDGALLRLTSNLPGR